MEGEHKTARCGRGGRQNETVSREGETAEERERGEEESEGKSVGDTEAERCDVV